MATAREGIHVVQSPDDRQLRWKLAKKITVINKSSDPMKIQNIRLGQLPQNIRSVLASIIAEVCRSCGASLYSLSLQPVVAASIRGGGDSEYHAEEQTGEQWDRSMIYRVQVFATRGQLQQAPYAADKPLSGSASEIIRTEVGDFHGGNQADELNILA